MLAIDISETGNPHSDKMGTPKAEFEDWITIVIPKQPPTEYDNIPSLL